MRKNLKALLVLGLLGGIIVVVLAILPKKQQLQITFETSPVGTHKALLYVTKAKPTDHEYDYHQDVKPENLRGTFATDTTLTLKQGSYVLVADTDQTFAAFQQLIDLRSHPEAIKVPATFSDQKLESLLHQEKASVVQTIVSSYPQANSYDISDGKLYKQGDWYGTTLTTKDLGDTQFVNPDVFRAILHKETSGWVLITKPPQLILSKLAYPNIPVDVLRAVNAQ